MASKDYVGVSLRIRHGTSSPSEISKALHRKEGAPSTTSRGSSGPRPEGGDKHLLGLRPGGLLALPEEGRSEEGLPFGRARGERSGRHPLVALGEGGCGR